MKLTALNPRWLQWRRESVDPNVFIDGVCHPNGERILLPLVSTLAEAHGIWFLCPLCFLKDGHSVICWFEGRVPDEAEPGPGRWTPQGTGFEDLTFVPGKRIQLVSVQLHGGCGWHGHITNGEVT